MPNERQEMPRRPAKEHEKDQMEQAGHMMDEMVDEVNIVEIEKKLRNRIEVMRMEGKTLRKVDADRIVERLGDWVVDRKKLNELRELLDLVTEYPEAAE